MALNFCFKGYCRVCNREHQKTRLTGFGIKICEDCAEIINKLVSEEYQIDDFISEYTYYKKCERKGILGSCDPEWVKSIESVDLIKLWDIVALYS